MQHTETYSLNLIETGDTFSPEPLNQNAQALEDALNAEAAARAAGDSALDARVVKLEGKHIVAGSYTGNGNTSAIQAIKLGFTPRVVLVHMRSPNASFMATSAYHAYYSANTPGVWIVRIVDGGFEVRNSNATPNADGTVYLYLAFD